MLRSAVVGACAALFCCSAHAVESVPPHIYLFGMEPGHIELPRLLQADFDPGTAGKEILSVALSCNISATNTNGYLTVTDRARFTIKSADAATTYFTTSTPAAITSANIPDYRLAKFQCGGTEQTYFYNDEGGDVGTPNSGGNSGCQPGFQVQSDIHAYPAFCDGVISHENFGWGFVKMSDNTRLFVVGQALTGGYCRYNASTSTDLGCTDINRYKITVFNLNGSVRWTKTFAAISNGLELDAPFSAAGDFLPAPGDEIRLGYSGFEPNGTTIRYDYINVGTGALISSATVTQDCPVANSCD